MNIPKEDQQTLLEKFKARPAAPTQVRSSEAEFTKQIDLRGNDVSATLRADEGTITEGTAFDFLKAEGLTPSDWQVTGFRKSQWDGPSGNPMESVRYNFRKIGTGDALSFPSLDSLETAIKNSRTKKKPTGRVRENTTLIACLADLQIGKKDFLGGTQQLLERLENSLENWILLAKDLQPEEIFVLDAGDILENYNNVASQAQTNDLRLTEQLLVAQRILWKWIDAAASLAPSVKVAGVPSNHARIRKGKDVLSEPFDDYGILNISTMSNIASVAPEKFSHVEFYTPGDYEDSLAIQSLSGQVVGLAHGDQASINGLPGWLAGQALNRAPIGSADIIIFGHYHHLQVQSVGKNQTMFICPTADNGSSWYRNKSGNESKPGVMSIVLDPNQYYGWSGPYIY